MLLFNALVRVRLIVMGSTNCWLVAVRLVLVAAMERAWIFREILAGRYPNNLPISHSRNAQMRP